MRSVWFNALRAGVSIGLIGLLVWWTRGRFHQVATLLAAVQVGWLIAGLLAYVAVTAALSARLQQVLSAAAVRVPWITVTRFTFVGMFFNNFLPTATGGDVVKAYYLGRRAETAWMAWAGVAMDRVVGWVTFLLLTAVAVWMRPQDPLLGRVGKGYVTAGGVVLAVAIIGWCWMRRQAPRLASTGRWQRIAPILELLARGPQVVRTLGVALLWSLVAQLLFVFTLWLLTRSLSLAVPFGDLLLVVPLVATASMLPSINGLGVRESAMVLCLERSIGREPALAVAVLAFIMLLAASLIGGILYAAQGGGYDRQRAAGDSGLSGLQNARSAGG